MATAAEPMETAGSCADDHHTPGQASQSIDAMSTHHDADKPGGGGGGAKKGNLGPSRADEVPSERAVADYVRSDWVG